MTFDTKRKEITEVFRVSYCNAIIPQKNDAGDPVYSVTMIFDSEDDIANLVQLAEEVAVEKFGSKLPPKFKWPWRAGVEGEFDLEKNPEYDGKIIVAARSRNYKPNICLADGTPLIDPSDFYSGCYARASVTCYAYGDSAESAKKTGGNKGVTFSLQNLMKVKDGDKLGGVQAKAEDDFAALLTPKAKSKKLFGNSPSKAKAQPEVTEDDDDEEL